MTPSASCAPRACFAAVCGTALASLALVASPLFAQQRDSVRANSPRTDSAQALGAIRVSVTRDAARSPFELPFALTTAPIAARPAVRRTGIGDLLLGVPGVQVQDRANPSQDPRIGVRGFGARSAFGVRGVRLLRDGVPLSLPDGQTPLDWVDLETIERIDVVRGTAAALYGNAAGGVLDLRSRAPEPGPLAWQARLWDGGGLQRAAVQLSGAHTRTGRVRETGWLMSATRTRGEGPRTWSGFEATNLFARGLLTVGATRLEVQGTFYDAPRAENTGALTAAELARDPRLPDSLNITRRSRKAVRQSQLALIAERPVLGGVVRASAFTSARRLDNPLPFAIVAVDRAVAGGGVHGTWRTTRLPWPVRLGVGGDVQQQDDDRWNYENCADVVATAPVTTRCPAPGAQERGAVRLDQQERAASLGAYGRLEVEAPGRLFVSGALRGDVVRFRVRDRFVTTTNADDSGDRTLRAMSPMLGLAWRARPTWSWYANLATAFETPTITELTNQVDGAAGLNRTLEPQRTRTLEAGTQALLGGRVRADLSVYQAIVRDELVAFDVPNQPGRRAFRNAGRTARRGAELDVRAAFEGIETGVSYTHQRFRFEEYVVGPTSFAGQPIPGIPTDLVQAFATARRAGAFATVELTAASRTSANDAATVHAAGYAAWTLRVGLDAPVVAGRRIEPVVAVENLFDRRYASSVVINATRNRYFEPGLPRRLSFVVRVH